MAPRRGRRNGLALDGILLIDKPRDWTSHDVVNFVRGRYRLAKVGHGGTLDPMATGLLVLLLGKGTKYSDWVMQGHKIYEGTYTLGSTTNSQDADGEIEETRPVPENLTRMDLENLLPDFIGDILQVPPMVSAIKKDGVPLYKMARRGESIEREPRPVTIYHYEITDVRLPEVDVRVVCSKGTYIRTLAHDFGQRLGCGAHLSALRRTFSGQFSVENTLEVEALRDLDLDALQARVLPLPSDTDAPDTLPLYQKFTEVPRRPTVLAIGAFDGLHLGHQQVMRQTKALAVRYQAQCGVMRFYPHPSRVIAPETAPPLLCDEAQISTVLQGQSVDFQLRLPFTPALSQQEPELFLENLMQGIPGLKGIVVGPNWRFGRQGRGDIALLHSWAATQGIEVCIAEATRQDDHLISSTRIRTCLSEGDLPAATRMLGRPYRLSGIVGNGKKYGRQLGFPTANIVPGVNRLLPPAGVYAMRVHLKNQSYLGGGYITHTPRLLEVHLLDFDGDLYGQPLAIDVLRFERPATPIADFGELRQRIQQDLTTIRNDFSE